MNIWPEQDAKSRFSELLDTCLSEGPQLITRCGAETAVLVPITEWKRLNNNAKVSLKALLLSNEHRVDLDIPARGKANQRYI